MAPNQNIILTAREMEVLALAWQCMETQPKIDVNKLAALTGYTPGSAGVTFNKIKQKIRALADSVSSDPPAVPSTPRKTNSSNKAAATPGSTARKRKNAAATAATGAMPGTPSKKSKKEDQDEIPGDDDDHTFFDTLTAVKEEDKSDVFGGGEWF